MSAAPLSASAAPDSLRFAKSESKTVGLKGDFMDTVRENSPRIVAGFKLLGDTAAALSGNPYLMGYAAFSIVGRLIAISWGTKANQRKMIAEHAQDGKDKNATASASVTHKITHPREYPIESSAALSTVGEVFETGYGASQFVKAVSESSNVADFMTKKKGITATIIGLFSVWSYANILLGKEKKKDEAAAVDHLKNGGESLTFSQSESKPVGIGGKLSQVARDNPVLTSSLVQLGCSLATIIGGLLEGDMTLVAYNTFGLMGNVVQAMFVRKKEFNIEGAQENAKDAGQKITGNDSPSSFKERYVERAEAGMQRT